MVALFATDLDDTIIFSHSRDASMDGLVIVDSPAKSPPHVMTERAAELLAAINASGALMPVTARSREVYERMRMPGGTPRYAAVAGGGILLVDGERDREWDERIAELSATAAPLGEMVELLARTPGLSLPRHVDGVYAVATIEDPQALLPAREVLVARALEVGWLASVQHAKLHLFSQYATKEAAMLEVAQRVGAELVIAAGDSLMDAGMLQSAHVGFRPASGELADQFWGHARTVNLQVSGHAGGEELLTRVSTLLDRVNHFNATVPTGQTAQSPPPNL